MAKKVSACAFAQFLKERLAAGDGYIMCATGQDPGKLSDWWFSGQYSGKQLEKALYWREHAERVWDCNGLAEGYYKDMTGTDVNTRCRYNYSGWCNPKGAGEIPVKYRLPGAALFKKSSYIHHVGYLVEPVEPGRPEGDWYIIEAKGVMHGVVRTKLSDGGWTHWGLMTKYFEYDTQAAGDRAVLGGRVLKRGCGGKDVQALQEILLQLGYKLPGYGVDGEFGRETEAALKELQAALDVPADGVYGADTHDALMVRLEALESPGEDAPVQGVRIAVTAAKSAYVRSGPGTDSGIVGVVLKGMEFDSPAASENGWRMIALNGKNGWISPKMCRVL